ncbi:MAG: acetyl-CoA C-acetyltransferase [Nitriliruptorales bacterium]
MTTETVIVGYARTPIGKFGGGFKPLSAMDLGAEAIKAALDRAGVSPEQVGYCIMGHVIQAGQAEITSKQAAVSAGLPMEVPCTTTNKVCLSGMTAIAEADRHIRVGDFDIVVAGGMESMTNAPYLLPEARFGYKRGSGEILDAMMWDGLTDPFEHKPMGAVSDPPNEELGISREDQDEFSVESHQRAADAWKNGRFEGEVVPVEVPQDKGDPQTVDQDEGFRSDASLDTMSKLPAVFTQDGTITPGNSSQVSDGGAAVVLTTREKAEELGLTPLATIRGWATTAGPKNWLHNQPGDAIQKVSKHLDLDPAGYDLYEINEAFAAVVIQAMRDLNISRDKVNVNGGAVAIGHPIGCTGTRIVVTLLHELHNRGGGRGVAALCGGGGQGDGLVIEVEG